MSKRIVHNVGGPMESLSKAYEYPFPIDELPAEVDPSWAEWLSPYIGRNPTDVAKLVKKRLKGMSPALAPLGKLIAEYVPFAMIVYAGKRHAP